MPAVLPVYRQRISPRPRAVDGHDVPPVRCPCCHARQELQRPDLTPMSGRAESESKPEAAQSFPAPTFAVCSQFSLAA